MVFQEHELIRLSVYTTMLDGIDNEAVLDEIKNFGHQPNVDVIGDYLGDTTHTFYEDTTFPLDAPNCEVLSKSIVSAVEEISGRKMSLDAMWSLFLKKGNSVSSHSHRSNTHMYPNEYFSVAYYVSAPPGGARLIFNAIHSNLIEQTYAITPETGMLVVFNSYITHMTERHQSEHDRVVVSASLSPTEPNLQPVPDWSIYKKM